MTEVTLMIHGRTYGVGCDDGQEKRVRELGQYIDKRVKEIAGAGGAATEAHLLVLSALVLADELFEAREHAAPNGAAVLREQVEGLAQENANQEAEIKQLQAQIRDLANRPPKIVERVVEARVGKNTVDQELEAKAATAIEGLAGRLESIAKRLQAA
jgi:cell division protein ZapA